MEDNLILEGLLSMVTELKERQEKQVAQACQQRTVGFARCPCWLLNRCGNYLSIVSGSVQPRIPETFIQFGKN